jgi:hypothetical protein
MNVKRTLSELRKSSSKIPKTNNGRIAVIVLTHYAANCANHGIQFWTPGMIELGVSQNTDRTISTFIEKL